MLLRGDAGPGRQDLLDSNPVLKEAIRLKNPYVDPMNFLQVKFLRERRRSSGEPDPPILRGLLLSIFGVAHGMRNTG